MNRILLALLLAAACKHSTSSSSTSHTETSTVTDSTSSESGNTSTVTTSSEEPGHSHTVIEEFGPPPEAESQGPDAGQELSGLPPQDLPATPPATPKLPRRGPLVKRTTIDADTGAKAAETHQQATQQATGATETKAAGKVDTTAKAQTASAPAASCVSLGWLYGAIVLVALLGIGYGALKLRKVV